jgi:uncharacterized protein YbjT (DUF2867 family)
MTSTTVLLAGATGMLGGRIAHHLLDAEKVALRLLIRSPVLADPAKRSRLDRLVERGAEVVEGDVSDPASLGRATAGVDVVVSALQGEREVLVDGQVALARAAANGVRRMLPSDFALDLFKASPGEHPAFDLRRAAGEAIDTLRIDQIHLLNGAFLDMLASGAGMIDFDSETGVATFWGTGEERFDATTVDDTARLSPPASSRSPASGCRTATLSPTSSTAPVAGTSVAVAARRTTSAPGSRIVARRARHCRRWTEPTRSPC